MPNVIDTVARHATTTPDVIAIRSVGDPLSYRQLLDASLRYAGALAAAGIGRGDRILLAAPSRSEFVVAYMGIQALGATVVTVNTMSTAAETEYFLSNSGASLAIRWHELGPAVADAAAVLGIPAWDLTEGAPVDADPVADIVDRPADDTAAILYTSGTTGRPKGAELTVANLLAAGETGNRVSRGTADDRIGTGLPLFHVYGQASVMMAGFAGGGSISLLPRFTPDGMIEMLRRDAITVMCGVPTMWNALLHSAPDDAAAQFSGLRVAVSGGASLPGEIARAFESRFGCTLLEGYGLTETTAMATFNDIDKGGKIGSVGAVNPGTEIEIRDTEGTRCPTGTIGEVCIKGPTVMKGYWQLPEATAAVLSADGWFRTGDLGVFDEDQDLRIVDRLKDLIIRGGYNVYPGEVEEVLYSHPEVVEAAVVGVPDPHYGEEVAAVVVTTPGSAITADDISAWCRERLSAYKIPRIIDFTDALPKGSTGKILKRDINRTDLRKTQV
ncbi:long-chain fatty acid--CoA ligase [Gordonia jinhuaensis]|uniref:Long-chain-fatty-acid--CoA ligase n=1 Tax=Gordonia jinhuaensis TaxID=1517702 RepID=A0A916WSQ7_9ACTN|nr:AMP-binding protein [Gordonia jinhuaensis]GGB27057.1 long-chain-fatty-acid--CoA ligase [Gordonia jinhuaensis]